MNYSKEIRRVLSDEDEWQAIVDEINDFQKIDSEDGVLFKLSEVRLENVAFEKATDAGDVYLLTAEAEDFTQEDTEEKDFYLELAYDPDEEDINILGITADSPIE